MKTAIIGGGLGGLMTAVLLAERGAEVTILERARELGGRARTTNTAGYSLNFGPHAIYRGGPAESVLTRIGVKPNGLRPKARGFVLHEGSLHTLPTGPVSLLTTGFLDAGGTWDAARLLGRIAKLEATGDETLGEWLARNVPHPRVRALFATLVMVATYTYPVEPLRARDAFVQVKAAMGPGVIYLHRGWQTLVDGVAARAAALGVTIATGARIAEVRSRSIVFDDGSEQSFDGVVVACGPRTAHELVPNDAAIARAAARAQPVEVACLDVVLERATRPATILLGADEPYYASVHSATAQLGPEGDGAVVHVAKYLAPGATATESELRAVLERLQPGAVVRDSRFLPRMVVMNARATADLGGLDGRIDAPDTDGLALVGDWVGPRGMLLDAVAASAEAAAERLVPTHAMVANG